MLQLPDTLAELAQYKQFVVRRADKVPLNPHTGAHASVTNPADWSDFNTAAKRCALDPTLGLGMVLTTADPFTCIDLDDAAGDAAITARHTELFQTFDSYSELSPSGKGLHIWLRGSVPSGIKDPARKIEVYSSARYMTLTLMPFRNVPIRDCNGSLTRLYNELASGRNSGPAFLSEQPATMPDDAVCRAATNAANGSLFQVLFQGHWQGRYPSQSEADQALCNIIAFYTDSPEQVKRIFRASALGQREKAKRTDYVGNMVRKAFDQKAPALHLDTQAAMARLDPTKQQFRIDSVPLAQTANDIEVCTMSEIVQERIAWLWNGYLPKGKLTLLAGAGGTGKSQLTLSIAAIVSNGGTWPDGTQCDRPGRVLIWSSEDDAADTIAPRLTAMGANLAHIHLVQSKIGNNRQRIPFNPATDIPLLKQKVLANSPIDLFIIDPIVSAVAGDMNKSNEVREGLQTIVDLASELKCAVVGITHFAKGTNGRNPAERVIGSVAFAAFARMVLVAAKDEEADRRVFVKAKSNISDDKGGFYYAIQPVPLGNGISATCVDWGGPIEGSSREILASVEHDDNKDDSRTQTDEAKSFLIAELKNGPRFAKELIEMARSQFNTSEKTLQRARRQLNIHTQKEGFGGWKWSLPLQGASNIPFKVPNRTD